ncbi:DUF4274 domain-containing protein [Mangrovivirga cuniculi]|uniref:DUF4274 domain-containing protein n=1 Tax=Mangrovivirga cuniculi TaxID=2715131 RepID=A0A4D7JJ22_9BACT|nr:DUF4274 domain-containing protein [Mangrovivirga cuniculi]QCK15581.1 hypothetical protein DCC35_12900 [Mangrovivirga cuniculi]
MLNDKEKHLINSFEGNNNLKKWIKSIKESNNPFFLKESAETYNWDDGFELPSIIANHPYCDKGTALTLFWLAEGIVYHKGEIAKDEYNGDWVNFCEMIGDKLINETYKEGAVSFNPGLSRVSIYKYKKCGIPEAPYKPVEGVKNR